MTRAIRPRLGKLSARATPRPLGSRCASAALRWRRAGAALLGALVLFSGERAYAWTEARVTTAAASLAVARSGAADVELELGIAIDAGWLEGLEIAGLDPDLALDTAFAVEVVSEKGERFTPSVRPLGGGRLLLSFPRREAPRRGRYRTRIRYHTELGGRATTPTGEGSVRFEWTFPGWQSGLDGVSVQVVAPPGAALSTREDLASSTIRSDVRPSEGGTLLTLRRAHLPRTVPWTIAFEVPEAEVARALRGPPRRAALSPPPAPARQRAPGLPRRAERLIALFALAAIAKRLAYDRAVRLRSMAPRPLVPLGSAAHALVTLAAAGVALWLGRRGAALYPLPLFAILLLSIQRSVVETAAPRLGAFRPVDREHLAKARRARALELLAPVRWLDGSHPLGLVMTGLALAAVFSAPDAGAAPLSFTATHGALLFFALMLTTPTTRVPSTPEQRLSRVVRLASRLRVSLADGAASMAFRLLVHEDAEGRLQDARLRVCTETRPVGLLRLDLVYVDRDGLGGHRGEHALLVVTRAGSAAEQLVARALPRLAVRRAPGGRRARIGSIQTHLEPLLAALASVDTLDRTDPPAKGAPKGAAEQALVSIEPRLAS